MAEFLFQAAKTWILLILPPNMLVIAFPTSASNMFDYFSKTLIFS
jgi:hypothetical protein